MLAKQLRNSTMTGSIALVCLMAMALPVMATPPTVEDVFGSNNVDIDGAVATFDTLGTIGFRGDGMLFVDLKGEQESMLL